jgi:DNA-binding response OmpR family regulator
LPLRRVDGNENPGHDAAAFRPQGDQFKLDHKGRCLQINRVSFHLSPREFAVLELLMLNPNLTLGRSVIASCIWGQGNADPRTVDATISRLRKTINQQPSSHRPACSVSGRGYQFYP